MSVRTVGAVAGSMHIDESGVQRPKFGLAEPELLGDPGAEAGDEHVGPSHDLLGDGPALGAAEIERDALLGGGGLVAGQLLAERHAMRVALAVLDLDHPGAERGGHGHAIGHGVEVAELDDGHPGERMGRSGAVDVRHRRGGCHEFAAVGVESGG